MMRDPSPQYLISMADHCRLNAPREPKWGISTILRTDQEEREDARDTLTRYSTMLGHIFETVVVSESTPRSVVLEVRADLEPWYYPALCRGAQLLAEESALDGHCIVIPVSDEGIGHRPDWHRELQSVCSTMAAIPQSDMGPVLRSGLSTQIMNCLLLCFCVRQATLL